MDWVTEKDRQWVQNRFPDLDFQEGPPLALHGNLEFDMLYDLTKKQYVINLDKETQYRGERIRDSYDIEIQFKTSEFSSLPQVYERGGRIDKAATDRKVDRIELHINPNGAACLCLKFQEHQYLPNGFNLPDYFHNLVIPFFYAQSYFEKYDKWPWGEYSHGDLGYLEGYGENSESPPVKIVLEFIALCKRCERWSLYQKLLQKKGRLKPHHYLCFCDSGRKIRKCHPKVFKGLMKLKSDLESLGLEV